MINSLIAISLMTLELLISEFIFVSFLEKKKFFWARFLGGTAICLAASAWIEIIYSLMTDSDFNYGSSSSWEDSLFKFIYYIFMFVMTIAVIKLSYKGSMWTILFYCSGGYALQHIAWNIASLIGLIPGLDNYLSANNTIMYFIEIIVCALLYVTVYLLFISNRSAPDSNKDIRGKVMLFLAVIFICIGISRLTTDNEKRDIISHLAESISAIVNCTFILILLFDLTDRDKAKNEVQTMKELMRREQEQYRLTKENIDLINIKCHDLKHQIQSLRKNASEPYIKQVEEAVMFYDSVVKTGNDVLDVILTEKSLLCEKNHIVFTCVAHGKDLAFMDDMDIYSLFGNAISNAFESVRNIKDEDKRCLYLNVHTENGVLSIHVENFYEGIIHFKNGLPVTDKGEDYHGFGMKSMNYIAHKYNGFMTISAEDGIFNLDFIFPLKDKKIK